VTAEGSPTEDFWSALPPDAAADLKRRAVPRTFRSGQTLLYRGGAPDRILIVLAGRVKIVATTPNGREVVLAFRGPGELVGELGALDGAPRSATVEAVEPVEALTVGVDTFRSFLADHPAAALRLLEMLSRRLRDADSKRIEFSEFTTIQRVAARLLEYGRLFGREEPDGCIRVPLAQEELAGATGASIESVGRALQTMRKLKCVETRRRDIRIVDGEALEALYDAGR
jgi:CRP/FNR family cyclic AMP-dependent transcriptional regulator